jgi:hypothetical protein
VDIAGVSPWTSLDAAAGPDGSAPVADVALLLLPLLPLLGLLLDGDEGVADALGALEARWLAAADVDGT